MAASYKTRFDVLQDDEESQSNNKSLKNVLNRYQNSSSKSLALFALAVLAFLFLGWSWSRPSFKRTTGPSYVGDVDWRNASAKARSAYRFWTEDQCGAMFHPLYLEADRAMDFWEARGGISFEDVDKASGIANARLLIYDNQLYVKGFVNGLFSRAYAQVALINEAVITSPEPLPNIEFAISINDWAHGEPLPIWELSREAHVEQVWLMPDYGFYSWPEPGVGSFQEVVQKTAKHEADHPRWSSKDPRLFWKGAFWVNPLRQRLQEVSAGRKWSDIQDMNWGDNAAQNRKTIDGHCEYKYLAHVEGGSYSGRLKFIQMCRSVIVTHELKYIQHFHHLMNSNASSPDQNTVVTPGEDWAELDATMNSLLADDVRAERIADNGYQFWRYWNGPAGINCYLRRMFHNYAKVQSFKPVLGYNDASYASFDLMRSAFWEIH